MQSNIIKYQGKKLHYSKYGKGRNTIVFIHGFMESCLIWDDFSRELSNEYQIIVPDLPGHGKSEVYGNEHSIELNASCVAEILEKENIEKLVVVGHSMGGYVSLALAEILPETVVGLCLFNSTSWSDSEQKKKDRDTGIRALKEMRQSFIVNLIPNLFAPDNREKHKNEIETLKKIALQTPLEGAVATLLGMKNRKDRNYLIDKAKFPLLLIVGGYDSAIPEERRMPSAKLPIQTTILNLPHIGHIGFIEARDQTLMAVRELAGIAFG